MKKSLILCGFLVAFAACKDDTKQLLKTVDGVWQVNTITYRRIAGPDSIARPQAVVLNFRNCGKTSNNTSPNNCGVNYIADGANYFPFVYQADGKYQTIYINSNGPTNTPEFRQVADQLIGGYQVLTLNDHELVIERDLQGSSAGFVSVRYSTSK